MVDFVGNGVEVDVPNTAYWMRGDGEMIRYVSGAPYRPGDIVVMKVSRPLLDIWLERARTFRWHVPRTRNQEFVVLPNGDG